MATSSDCADEAAAAELRRFPVRLSKFISLVAASEDQLRSEADARAAVSEGRVTVDGDVASDPDILVFPRPSRCSTGAAAAASPSAAVADDLHTITLDGRPLPSCLPPSRTPELYWIDKPPSCVCDLSEDNAITRVCASLGRGFAPVGQLDIHTTGLLLLTNDGDLSRLLCLPGLLPKTYTVGFNAFSDEDPLSDEQRRKLTSPRDVSRPSDPKSAVEKFSTMTAPREMFRILSPKAPPGSRSRSRFECDVTISAGQNHIVKRLMSSVGIMVSSLQRVAVGNLSLPVAGGTEPIADGASTDVPLRCEEKRRFRKGSPDPGPDPTPVQVGDSELAELLRLLDYHCTLKRLRRADLICRWRHTGDERLGRWLDVTDEEAQRECYHGFKRLTCKHPHASAN